MSGMSDYLEQKVAEAVFKATAFSVSSVYVSLHTADPGDASGASELADSGYARKAATFGSVVSGAGTISNDAEVLFNAVSDVGSVSITHFGLWDSASGGNYLGSGALATPKGFSQGDVPRFPAGSLVATFS
jgi:hypothetical protein